MLGWLSGLPLTLFGLTLLLLGVFPVVTSNLSATVSLAPGFGVLAVNLMLAILVREKIRHNLPLLVFHIALLLIMLSVVVSRLTYFKGWAIMSENETLRQPTGIINQGPWHRSKLNSMPVLQQSFLAYFDEEGRRLDTESWLQPFDAKEAILITNKETADVAGYQFTISNNLGFSVDLTWISGQGDIIRGLLQMPSQISQPETQGRKLILPDITDDIWLGLEIESARKSFFYPYFSIPDHFYFTVVVGSESQQLKLGESIDLFGGTLILNNIIPWIGYEMYYDPAIYFLLIASIIAVIALGYFLSQRLGDSHWIQENEQ